MNPLDEEKNITCVRWMARIVVYNQTTLEQRQQKMTKANHAKLERAMLQGTYQRYDVLDEGLQKYKA
jgi:hypothetical protein